MKLLIAFILSLFVGYANAQVNLSSTSDILELSTSSTAGIDYLIKYNDWTTSGATPGDAKGKITTATTTTVVAAPAASTTRIVNSISLVNISTTASNTLVLKKDVSATEYIVFTVTLNAGEKVEYGPSGLQVFDANMRMKVTDPSKDVNGLGKFAYKSSTASDATGYWMTGWKDAGLPGAWAPGTPGVAGRDTNGNAVADAGCISFPDATLTRYLTSVNHSSSTPNAFMWADVLWVNSGLVVTTTTAQTVNSVALPARDVNGTVNGEGCMIGLVAVAALGNAATISNSTISYTNSEGTAGRTASLVAVVGSQVPATPVIGTVVWFTLQAGDVGVRSIQSITLSTTYTSGTMSLIIARPIAAAPIGIGYQYMQSQIADGHGVKIYNDACLLPFWQSASTTAPVWTSFLNTTER